jgi:hypothetical protein
VRAGVSEGLVMKLCGWKTRSMFDRYNVADARDLADGVGRLSEFLEGRLNSAPMTRGQAGRATVSQV